MEWNAEIIKPSVDGFRLVYATDLGGGGRDIAERLALDGTDAPHVSTFTNSPNFRSTAPYLNSAPHVNLLRRQRVSRRPAVDVAARFAGKAIAHGPKPTKLGPFAVFRKSNFYLAVAEKPPG